MDEFLRGYLAGLKAFAWWRDGVEYVGGTCGTTLAEAEAEARRSFDMNAEQVGSVFSWCEDCKSYHAAGNCIRPTPKAPPKQAPGSWGW